MKTRACGILGASLVAALLFGCDGSGSSGDAAGNFNVIPNNVPPSISSLAPRRGTSAGGTVVTVSGSGFVAGRMSVTVNGIAVAANVVSPNSLTFTTPGLAAAGNPSATVVVSDTQTGLSATRASAFGYIVRLTDPTPAAGDNFGTSGDDTAASRALGETYTGIPIAIADFNGDGRLDLAVGVPFDDTGAANAGQVVIFLANAAGQFVAAPTAFTQAVPVAGQTYGFSLAAGEVSGDGIVDLVIGAPGAVFGAANALAGQAFVRTGDGVGGFPAGGETALANPAQVDDLFGFAVALGNYDGGDAALEILVGGPERGVGLAGQGVVRDYDAPAPFAFSGVERLGAAIGSNLGLSLLAVNLNNNALIDAAFGQPNPPGNGAVRLNLSDGTLALSFFPGGGIEANFGATTAEAGSHFGNSLASADFDADGNQDVVIGQNRGSPGALAQAGRTEVLFGNGIGGQGGRGVLTEPTPAAGNRFGEAVATGDFNGDGIPDLAVQSSGTTVGGTASAGQVHLYVSGGGSRTFTFVESLDETLTEGPEANAFFGLTLRAADLNADGLADLVIATVGTAGGFAGAGEVYVFYQPR